MECVDLSQAVSSQVRLCPVKLGGVKLSWAVSSFVGCVELCCVESGFVKMDCVESGFAKMGCVESS